MSDEANLPDKGKLEINRCIIEIMRKVGAIGKERKNASQGYNFRGIDDAMNALHHLFAEQGIFTTTKVLEQTREERSNKSGGVLIYSILKVRFTFHALDGSSQECEMVGEGMDSGDKASNKSLSVALKYALLQMFMIPTKEFIDPENDNPDPAPRQNPGTQRLPEGSYQQAPTVPKPATANPGSNPAMITTWKAIKLHVGKNSKGKLLGDLPETIIKDYYDLYVNKECVSKEDKMLKTALLVWHSEKETIGGNKALLAKLQADKIDPELFGKALKVAGIVDKNNAMDFNDDEADYALSVWDDCLVAIDEAMKGEK